MKAIVSNLQITYRLCASLFLMLIISSTAFSQAPLFDNSGSVIMGENKSFIVDINAYMGAGGASDLGITYSILDDDADLMSIDASTGILTFNSNSLPDFESPSDDGADNTYNVTVRATGSGGDSDLPLTIEVRNNAEHQFLVGKPGDPTYNIPDEIVAGVTASYSGYLTVYFSEHYILYHHYSENPAYVTMSYSRPINIYLIKYYSDNAAFEATRNDQPVKSGQLPHTDRAEVPFELNGLDEITFTNNSTTDYVGFYDIYFEIPPLFSGLDSEIKVAEGTALVADINASDGFGSGDDTGITYSIVGSDADLFTIDSGTGELSFNSAPPIANPTDSNEDNMYVLDVIAEHDNGLARQTLRISVALEQEITFEPLPAVTFGDAPFNLTASTDSDLEISYTTSNEAVATISGNTVTIVGAGTTTISANQAGNNDYFAADEVQQTLTVNKADQTITFDALANRTFGDANFELTATGEASSNPVTYTSSNPSVATVAGNSVTIEGAGTTTITANQAGNGNYNAAAPVQQTLTVNKADQVITFEPMEDVTYGELEAFLLTATGGGSGNEITYSSSDESIAEIYYYNSDYVYVFPVTTGTITITANQAGNDNYNAATPVQQTLTVNKADQVITFDALETKTFGDDNFELVATGGYSGNPVTFTSSDETVATVDENMVTILGAGTTTISAHQAGDDRYNDATSVEQTLTISQAGQTITFGELATKTYGDEPFDLTATADSDLDVTYASSDELVATISGSTVTIVGAGTAIITASQAGDANYNAATSVEQTLAIGQASQTISFGELATKTYGDEPFDLTATADSDLDVTYASSDEAVATISGSTVTIVGAGTAIITASQAGDDNYNAADEVQQVLTVNKADQEIMFDAISDIDLLNTNTVMLVASSDTETPIVFELTAGDGSISGTTLIANSTGIFTVEASQAGNANYNPATASQTFTVTDSRKDNQTITFDAIADKSYGDVFTLDATASSDLDVSYAVVSGPATLSGVEVTVTGVGLVTIEASQPGDDDFNPAIPVVQGFNAGKTTLTVIAIDKTRAFNTANPALAIGYDGFIGSDSEADLEELPAASTVADIASDAGSYAITVTGGSDDNYDFQYEEGILTITKVTTTITLSNLEQEVDGTVKEPTITTEPSGLTYDLTWEVGNAPVEVGNHNFTVMIDEVNYSGSASGTLTLVEPTKLGNSTSMSVQLFPNPVSSYLTVKTDFHGVLLIYGISGVLEKESATNIPVNVSELSLGSHILQVIDDTGQIVYISKFIKK